METPIIHRTEHFEYYLDAQGIRRLIISPFNFPHIYTGKEIEELKRLLMEVGEIDECRTKRQGSSKK